MTCLQRARRLLRLGGRLVLERAEGLDMWSVHSRAASLPTGRRRVRVVHTIIPLSLAAVDALKADRDLALTPAGDQLPGFPAECSQTWVARKRRRARTPASAGPAAALQLECPP